MARTFHQDPRSTFSLRARFLFPVASPPIRHGVLVVDGGRIQAIGGVPLRGATVDLGNAAILPGLVNAHAHLEFSDLAGPLGHPSMPFTKWIAEVVAWRRSRDGGTSGDSGWRAAATQQGLEESLRSGVTTLADVTTSPAWKALYREERGKVFSFLELIGLWKTAGELLEKALAYLAGRSPRRIGRGVSPHAPYTVPLELLGQLCAWSAAHRFPLAMHLAETREELEWLRAGSGSFRELLEGVGAWDGAAIPRGLRPLDYLQVLARSHRALVIHGNYLAAAEMELLASCPHRLAVVYCPRTHAYFGHDAYPLAQMLKLGVRVALGTDSRASNPDLSLLEEMRYLARHRADVAPGVLLRLGTLAGAEALGCEGEAGSLRPGHRADFLVVRLDDNAGDDPYEALFGSSGDVVQVYKCGRRVFSAEGS